MKKRINRPFGAAALTLALLTSTQDTLGEAFTIDAVHSTAIFGVRHMGAGRFYGRFNDLSGTITHTEDDDSDLAINFSIAVGSVDTGSDKLNGHLKSPDFFNEREFATITFKSKSAKKTGDGMYEVKGDLTIHGVTKTITVPVQWLGTASGRRGKRCGLETQLTLKRSDFGMNYGIDSGMLGDEVKITVALEAGAGGRGRGARRDAGTGLPARMAQRDKNGDGKIQKSEAPERMKQAFDELDTNKDGALDAKELRASRGRFGRGNRNGEL